MVNVEDTVLDVLAVKMNKAGGLIEGLEGVVDFEEIYNEALNGRQKMADKIVKARTGEVPENLVAEIEKERGKKSDKDSKVEGKVAEVEEGLKKLMEAGKQPSHAIIEDDKFEIFGRSKEDDDELDR